jgi:predicted nucleotidyltransferase
LLVDEANNFKRWKEEFKELFKEGRIILLFGSAVKNYNSARDIDLMIIAKDKDSKEINAVLREKENLLPKKLHAIKLTAEDFSGNIDNKNKATIDIIKNAIVLYGQDKYIEIIKNVTGF